MHGADEIIVLVQYRSGICRRHLGKRAGPSRSIYRAVKGGHTVGTPKQALTGGHAVGTPKQARGAVLIPFPYSYKRSNRRQGQASAWGRVDPFTVQSRGVMPVGLEHRDRVGLFTVQSKGAPYIYSVEDAILDVQDLYYVGVPAPIVFSMDVYNLGIQIGTAEEGTHNYELKLFAQQGAMLNMDAAFDLTPDLFLFTPEWQEEHADDLHRTMTPKRYTNASAIIEISELACRRQMDHLFLVVLSREAGVDWILYNNWVSAEITIDSSSCTVPDAVDLIIADFGIQPTGRLLLGGWTDLQLNLNVDVISTLDKVTPDQYTLSLIADQYTLSLIADTRACAVPVFISRHGHKLQLPTAILPGTAAQINEETLSDRTINLGSYIGCYKDMKPGLALNTVGPKSSTLTVAACIQACAGFNTQYAGLQNGVECYCGEDYSRHGRAMESDCDEPCGGNNDQICGGHYRLSVYTTSHNGGIRLPMEELMGFCGMSNTVSVVIDPHNNVLETNKHNNMLSVEDVWVTAQPGDTYCTGMIKHAVVVFSC
ncbi:hypothetical protein Bbelb_028800 [Branchiostoma belcheri]|nr:hypothetical protein Bbelb_028800 [Branchiostoma belcheri]